MRSCRNINGEPRERHRSVRQLLLPFLSAIHSTPTSPMHLYIPWHTGTTMYIPFDGNLFALEQFSRPTSRRSFFSSRSQLHLHFTSHAGRPLADDAQPLPAGDTRGLRPLQLRHSSTDIAAQTALASRYLPSRNSRRYLSPQAWPKPSLPRLRLPRPLWDGTVSSVPTAACACRLSSLAPCRSARRGTSSWGRWIRRSLSSSWTLI